MNESQWRFLQVAVIIMACVLVFCVSAFSQVIGPNVTFHRELRIGGGFGDTGLDINKNGDVDMDGDLGVGGTFTLTGGIVGDLDITGNLTVGPDAASQSWSPSILIGRSASAAARLVLDGQNSASVVFYDAGGAGGEKTTVFQQAAERFVIQIVPDNFGSPLFEPITIDSATGFVGFDDTTPTFLVDIKGGFRVVNDAQFDDDVGIIGSLGVGTLSPTEQFEIFNASGPKMTFLRDPGGGSIGVNFGIGQIIAKGVDDAVTMTGGIIKFEADAAWVGGTPSAPTRFIIEVTPSGSATPVEALRVDPDGEIGIGQLNPDALLDIGGTMNVDGNVILGDASTDTIIHTGRMIVRSVTDAGPMTATNGTVGEIVFNTFDTKFYGCTITGTPATWAAFH